MPAHKDVLQAELDVLRVMCTGTPQGTVWDRGMLLFDRYPFQDALHQLVFDVLQEINTDLPAIIRQQLPARLTRKGFPSVPFEKFFEPHGLDEAAAVARMKQLREWMAGQERPDATVR